MKQSRTLWIATALGVALAFGCQPKRLRKRRLLRPREPLPRLRNPSWRKPTAKSIAASCRLSRPSTRPITELDARKATAPPPFKVDAPEGAPNVVIVLIDDIGFGATDTFGGVIETPTLSRLADEGIRFNQFHTTALCSPTRASLKSGRNHHATNVGSVMEIATGFPGNRGQIPPDVVPVAEILRQNGYSTAPSASGTKRRPGRSRSRAPTIDGRPIRASTSSMASSAARPINGTR